MSYIAKKLIMAHWIFVIIKEIMAMVFLKVFMGAFIIVLSALNTAYASKPNDTGRPATCMIFSDPQQIKKDCKVRRDAYMLDIHIDGKYYHFDNPHDAQKTHYIFNDNNSKKLNKIPATFYQRDKLSLKPIKMTKDTLIGHMNWVNCFKTADKTLDICYQYDTNRDI